jgi:23S rRNA pseudouridine955/2504/2580 synthase
MSVETRIVSEDEADVRLDRWMRRHFPGLTQGTVEKLCRTGQVRVGGKRVTAATRLQPNDTVRVPPVPTTPAPPPEPRPVDEKAARDLQRMVIYRDEWIIALNKPHGLPVQGGPGITRHVDGMLDALRFGSEHRPRLVHRIDRDTSGLLLLARTPGVAAKLAAAFRGRDVKKTYWAVVVGRPDPAAGRVDRPLARIGGPRGERSAMAAAGDIKAAQAVTDYETLDVVAKRFAFMALSPLTGRTHQLRVHMASLGTPILGDTKYGVEHSTMEGFSSALHLHARALSLPHPDGGTLALESDLPPHMRETFAALGFSAAAAKKGSRKKELLF